MNKRQIKYEQTPYVQLEKKGLDFLGVGHGDKVFLETRKDGSLVISAGKEIEIDISDFSKDQLVEFIKIMNEEDLTFAEFIEKALRESLKELDIERRQSLKKMSIEEDKFNVLTEEEKEEVYNEQGI